MFVDHIPFFSLSSAIDAYSHFCYVHNIAVTMTWAVRFRLLFAALQYFACAIFAYILTLCISCIVDSVAEFTTIFTQLILIISSPVMQITNSLHEKVYVNIIKSSYIVKINFS